MTNRLDRLEALTGQGLKVVDAAVTDHVANEERLLSPLSASQRAQFDAILRRLLASFE